RSKLENRPSVWMLSQRSMRGYWGDRVCPDNEIIGRLAADHLSARGHKRIAYLYFNATHMGFRGRAEAFCETAEEYGVQVDLIPNHPQSVQPGSREEHGPEATEKLVDELLALDPRPTAVFVPRDRLTVKVYRALRRRGIEPGRDIEIVSCDNEPILEALDPRPATIDVRPELIGRRAVDQLAFKMSKPADSTRSLVTVEPVLIGPDESEIVSQRQGTPAAEDTSPLASRSTRNGSPIGGEHTTTTGLNGAS
ncbi:MAG: substrate-binding domain-containing protein, partial [Planctomycetota bacterium]